MQNIVNKILKLKKPVFMVGSSKNAGKTTLFVRLLDEIRDSCKNAAFFSTGRDGEKFDAVFGHEKPRIYVEAGDIFVTDEQSVFADVQLLKPLDYKTSGSDKRLSLWKALSSGRIELSGAPGVHEVWKIIEEIKNITDLPVIIDGALDRKAALAGGECAFISVFNITDFPSVVSFENSVDLLIKTMNLPIQTGQLPVVSHEDLIENEISELSDHIIFKGALTSGVMNAMIALNSDIKITLLSPVHSFLNADDFMKYYDRLSVLSRPELLAVALNDFGNFDAESVKRLGKITGNIPLINAMRTY